MVNSSCSATPTLMLSAGRGVNFRFFRPTGTMMSFSAAAWAGFILAFSASSSSSLRLSISSWPGL